MSSPESARSAAAAGPSSGSRSKNVFISYAREDAPIAQEIARALRGVGHHVDIDTESLPGGADFSTRLDEMIRASDCLVVIWSKSSVASDWVRAEAGRARTLGKPIIPVLVDDSVVPLPFSVLHTLRFTPGELEHLGQILRAVGDAALAAAPVLPGPSPRPGPRWRGIASMAVVVIAAGALAVGWKLRADAGRFSPELRRAIASYYSEDYCTVSDDKVFQCVYPTMALCEYNASAGLKCVVRPETLSCVRPASTDIAAVYAAGCYVTRKACAAASDDCGEVEIALRHRTDVPTGAPDAAALGRETSMYDSPWLVVFGDHSNLVTSFRTESECTRYISGMPGAVHRCVPRPASLFCRYGAMMFKSGRQIECFMTKEACDSPSPDDTSCVEVK